MPSDCIRTHNHLFGSVGHDNHSHLDVSQVKVCVQCWLELKCPDAHQLSWQLLPNLCIRMYRPVYTKQCMCAPVRICEPSDINHRWLTSMVYYKAARPGEYQDWGRGSFPKLVDAWPNSEQFSLQGRSYGGNSRTNLMYIYLTPACAWLCQICKVHHTCLYMFSILQPVASSRPVCSFQFREIYTYSPYSMMDLYMC